MLGSLWWFVYVFKLGLQIVLLRGVLVTKAIVWFGKLADFVGCCICVFWAVCIVMLLLLFQVGRLFSAVNF